MRPIVLVLALAATAGLSAAALAGEPSTLGQDHLILQVNASPPKAGTTRRPQIVGIEFDTRLYTDNGQRSVRSVRTNAFRFTGFRFNPSPFAKCVESKLEKRGPSACPAGSRLGSGTAIADARPTPLGIITAKAQIFNGILDVDANGKPITPKPALLVYAKAPNLPAAYIPTLFKGRDGLITDEGNPPAPGGQSLYSITALHVKLPAKTMRVRGQDGWVYRKRRRHAVAPGATCKPTRTGRERSPPRQTRSPA